MVIGRSSGKPPTENTPTVNITHEILDDIREVFQHTVAVTPTREEEKDYGYDISVDWQWMKTFALQFKTFRTKGSITLNGSHTDNEYYKFQLDREQHKQLIDHFPLHRMAFYVLPVFPTRDDLEPPLLESEIYYRYISNGEPNCDERSRVIFVDIHDVPLNSTMISISTNPANYFQAVCYCQDREHHPITMKNVFTWEDIWKGLLGCSVGAKLRKDGEPTADVYNIAESWDQPIEEQTSKSKIQDTIRITLGDDSLPEEAVEWDSSVG